MAFVYILFSEKGNRFYVGQTLDFESRIKRHNSHMEFSTAPYVPWNLVCLIEKSSRGEAMILEKKLKNLNTEDLKRFITKYGIEGREA